jgi:type IV secretory pathway protease TraF
MTAVQRTALVLAGVLLTVMTLAWLYDVGPGRQRELKVNLTSSLPVGLYWCQRIAESAMLSPGTLVAFDPPPWIIDDLHKVAPHLHLHTMLKEIIAAEPDTVCLQGRDVTVNGAVIAQRPLLETYPLMGPTGCMLLEHEQLFLMGTDPRSYDSRYFGPAERAWMQSTCTPVLTWETHS